MQRIQVPQTTPVLTYILLAINVIVFVLDFFTGRSLTLLGAKTNDAILQGEYWRLITPMFLHGSLLHIGFNSYFLFVIGPQVERSFGTLRFAAIYFLSGICGVLFSFALTPSPSIGASGALFGLIGALIPFLYRNRRVLYGTRSRIMSIIQVIVVNLLIGLSPGIDNWGHLGGLVGGLVLSWLVTPLYAVTLSFDGTPRIEDRSSPTLAWLAFGGFAAALFGLLELIIWLNG